MELNNNFYYSKYNKYKNKYLQLKQLQIGGSSSKPSEKILTSFYGNKKNVSYISILDESKFVPPGGSNNNSYSSNNNSYSSNNNSYSSNNNSYSSNNNSYS